jgi:hypothetical protein
VQYRQQKTLKAPGETNPFALPARNIALYDTSSIASLDFAKKWIRDCSHCHTRCSPDVSQPLPTRILEIVSQEPVPYITLRENRCEMGRYIAVSHCWGGGASIQLTRQTLIDYQKGIAWSILPRLFQDIVSVAVNLSIQYVWIDSLCIYSHRTTMNYFESLRFVPQFFEGFNFTHLASQIWQYTRLRFQYQSLRFALPIIRLDITRYPCSKTRQFSLRRRRSTM